MLDFSRCSSATRISFVLPLSAGMALVPAGAASADGLGLNTPPSALTSLTAPLNAVPAVGIPALPVAIPALPIAVPELPIAVPELPIAALPVPALPVPALPIAGLPIPIPIPLAIPIPFEVPGEPPPVTNSGPGAENRPTSPGPAATTGLLPSTVGAVTRAGDAQAARVRSDLFADNDAAGSAVNAVPADLIAETLPTSANKATATVPLALDVEPSVVPPLLLALSALILALYGLFLARRQRPQVLSESQRTSLPWSQALPA